MTTDTSVDVGKGGDGAVVDVGKGGDGAVMDVGKGSDGAVLDVGKGSDGVCMNEREEKTVSVKASGAATMKISVEFPKRL